MTPLAAKPSHVRPPLGVTTRALLIAGAALLTGGPATALDAEDLYAKDAPAVCAVLVDGVFCGTGFLVEGETVVTNAHVARDAEGSFAVLFDGARHPATVLLADSAADVAFLRVAGLEDREPIELREEMPRAGQEVWLIGYDAGTLTGLSPGLVAGPPVYQATDDPPAIGAYRECIRTKVSATYGSSGSPLLASDGRAIGLHWGIKSNGSLAMSIPARRVRELLEWLHQRLDEGAEPPVTPPARPYLGLSVRETWETPPTGDAARKIAKYERESLHYPHGVLVSGVLDKSPAQSADVRDWDLLLAVGGEPVASAADYARAVEKLEPGTSTTVTFERVEGADVVTLDRTVFVGNANADVLSRYGKLYAQVRLDAAFDWSKHVVIVGSRRMDLRISLANTASFAVNGFALSVRLPEGVALGGDAPRLVNPRLQTSEPLSAALLTSPEGVRLPALEGTVAADPERRPAEHEYVEITLEVKAPEGSSSDYVGSAITCVLFHRGAENARDYVAVVRTK